MNVLKTIIISCIALATSACANIDLERRITKQGNVINEEQVNRLQVGLTKTQVESLMGSPLLEDTFNPNRYTYVYTLSRGNEREIYKHVVVYFENNRISNIEVVAL